MPNWTQELEARLASLRLTPAREREIIDELSEHLELRYGELRNRGVDDAEALALVRAELLHEDALAEFMRPLRQAHAPPPPSPVGAPRRALDAGGPRTRIAAFFDSVGRDLRLALRGLRRRPAFALAAVLTLALGIGATTAIFSVVYSVLIKPLPYPNADELVRIRHSQGELSTDLTTSATQYFTYREENRTLANIGLWQNDAATMTGLGEPERVRALRVSDGMLQALGVQPLLGRGFTEQEHGPAADGPAPVILSYGFWQRRFGGDEAALGRELSLDSRPAQIVGIMPAGFRFLDSTLQPDVILAVRLNRAEQVIGIFNFHALARLEPGVTVAEARADLERMMAIWADAWPLFPGTTKEQLASSRIAPVVRPLKDDVVGGVASTLWLVMGAIGAVLLVACANIANLMLVRADERRQELAVRAALGAVPARIARESLVESLALGVIGGALGLVLAYLGLRVFVAMGPSDLPRLQEIGIHTPVLAFTAAVSLASTLLFGSITALKHAFRIDTPMSCAARGSSAGRERNTARSTLVVVQVALALVLVVSAALMIRTFQALRDVEPGFSDPATIQTARIWIPDFNSDVERYIRMQHEMLDKIAALPGVAAAAFTHQLPMEGQSNYARIMVEGQVLAAGEMAPPFRTKYVSPGYFEAMGTRMIAGRDVTWSDLEAGGRVAVVSEDFARTLAATPAGALGKRIRIQFGVDAWCEVIGVVQGVRDDGVHAEAPAFVYWPARMVDAGSGRVVGMPAVAFVARSERAGTAGFVDEIREAVRSVSASIPVAQPRTMHDLYSGSLARTSFVLAMLGIAGGMALVLGVIGIYGVIAYVVTQRAREIGIRAALGASRRQLERMFLRQGLKLAAAGAAIGLVAAAALGRSMSSLLFGVGPADPAAYLAALAVVMSAAALATYLPARRAAAIDPIETLKAE